MRTIFMVCVFAFLLSNASFSVHAAEPLSVVGTLERLPTGLQGQVILVKNGKPLENLEVSEGGEDVLRLVLVTAYLIREFPEIEKRLKDDIKRATVGSANVYMNVHLEKNGNEVEIRARAKRGYPQFTLGISFDVDIMLDLKALDKIRIHRRI